MAKFETKPNTGSLFDNDRKLSDKHPDYNGSALIDGKEYWISGWINDEQGKKYRINLAFKIKEDKPATTQQRPTARQPEPKQETQSDDGQEIPF